MHHDLAISRSALQKMLVDAGLMWKLLHKIAQERDAEAQADFNADEFRDFIVEQVVSRSGELLQIIADCTPASGSAAISSCKKYSNHG